MLAAPTMRPSVSLQRRHAERDVHAGAVLVLPLGVVVLDRQTRSDAAAKQLALLVADVVGQQGIDGAPDQLGGAVAEQALCSPVPAQDDAVHGVAQDGVARGVDDRGEALMHQLLAPPLRDVLDDGEARPAAAEIQVVAAHLDLAQLARAGAQAPAAGAGEAALAWQAQHAPQALAILRCQQLDHREPIDLVAGVTRERAQAGVGRQDRQRRQRCRRRVPRCRCCRGR